MDANTLAEGLEKLKALIEALTELHKYDAEYWRHTEYMMDDYDHDKIEKVLQASKHLMK